MPLIRHDCQQLLSAPPPGWMASLVAAGCAAGAVVWLKRYLNSRKVDKKVAEAKSSRDETLRQTQHAVSCFTQQHSEIDRQSILSLPITELSGKLKNGHLSAEAVLYSYLEKALELQNEVNCVTSFLPECQDQLQDLEKYKDGILFGIPVSIKENVNFKGRDSSCGLCNKLGCPAAEDSVIVQVLKKQGAVPFVKTNVPQSMMNYECSNQIYGQTLNPHNQRKTPGGSSGGEGALIAGRGSILGIGSDIAGSIRIPASFCGICGLKTTSRRISGIGVTSSVPGAQTVLISSGPMARDVDGLALSMKALLSEHMFYLDPTVPPLYFNDQIYTSRKALRIGYYEVDNFTKPSPSMQRCFWEVKELLEKSGHTLVPFTPPEVEYAILQLTVRALLADGGSTLLNNFKEGKLDPNLRPQTFMYKLPPLIKKIISFLLKPLYPRISKAYGAIVGLSSVKDLWKLHVALDEYRERFIAEWRRLQLDVVLCPMLGPAYNLGFAGHLTTAVSYTALYNLLDFPAGVVPVGRVTEKDEMELKNYKGFYEDIWDKLFKKAVEDGLGLPVSVQCVALPWQEELCLRFMKEVETLVKET
ncbi:fatty-acid amide hydrolase 1 [Erpetoichthys calabaricus]|nr:fatty-acid amide hydrolase 1 [Erpetoichthys calabaricus]